MDETDIYAMGRTAAERDRLSYQDRVYGPHSRHLLQLAGVRSGMSVLDVGCGPGTTTRLLAELVGPDGQVVGVDEDPQAIRDAEDVSADAGIRNVRFVETPIEALDLAGEFDVLFGRLILLHLSDPAGVIRALLGRLRPGAIVSFQEPNLGRARAVPEVESWSTMMRWTISAMRQAGSEPDMGDRLPEILRDAGLPTPTTVGVSVGGDADSAAPAFVHQAARTMAPMTVASGAATMEDVEALTLEDVISETRAKRATLFIPELVAAWTTTPDR